MLSRSASVNQHVTRPQCRDEHACYNMMGIGVIAEVKVVTARIIMVGRFFKKEGCVACTKILRNAKGQNFI